MRKASSPWNRLFLFCFGLALGTSFCMKWMESSFYYNNELFTIMGLELFYPKEKVVAVLTGIDAHVKSILRFHLTFDFAFMAGIFPGIAAACMIARERLKKQWGIKLLFFLAALQTIAWVLDIKENWTLLAWVERPVISEFEVFHFIVATKWIIALTGALAAILVLLLNRRQEH